MYLPCFVFPYQRVPGWWYTPESVFTHTVPALFAGGACCVFVVFDAGALAGLPGLAASVAAGLFAGAVGVAAGAAVVDCAWTSAAVAGTAAFFLSFFSLLWSFLSSSPVGCGSFAPPL